MTCVHLGGTHEAAGTVTDTSRRQSERKPVKAASWVGTRLISERSIMTQPQTGSVNQKATHHLEKTTRRNQGPSPGER